MLPNKWSFIYPNWETKTNIIANFAGYPAAAAGGAARRKRENIQMNLQHTVCNGIIYIQRALGALLPSACSALYVVCSMQNAEILPENVYKPGAGPPTHSLIIFPVPSAVEAARPVPGDRHATGRGREKSQPRPVVFLCVCFTWNLIIIQYSICTKEEKSKFCVFSLYS